MQCDRPLRRLDAVLLLLSAPTAVRTPLPRIRIRSSALSGPYSALSQGKRSATGTAAVPCLSGSRGADASGASLAIATGRRSFLLHCLCRSVRRSQRLGCPRGRPASPNANSNSNANAIRMVVWGQSVAAACSVQRWQRAGSLDWNGKRKAAAAVRSGSGRRLGRAERADRWTRRDCH